MSQFVLRTGKAAAAAAAYHGRSVWIAALGEGDLSDRFGVRIEGEPVVPVEKHIRRDEVLYGLNLIENPQFDASTMPWRVVTGTCPETILSAKSSDEWRLEDAQTAFFAIPRSVQSGSIEYVWPRVSACVPILPGRPYIFEGYFGLHRCRGSVLIQLFDQDGTLIREIRERIPPSFGGPKLEAYSHVVVCFTGDRHASHARIVLSIDEHKSHQGDPASRSYLFFTKLGFGVNTEPSSWTESFFTIEQLRLLGCGATLVELRLPRRGQRGQAEDLSIDVIEMATGGTIDGAPVLVKAPPDLKFTAHNFDGVTISGDLSGIDKVEIIDLLVDCNKVSSHRVTPTGSDENVSVLFSLPAEYLDGLPHLIEIVESTSGLSLYLTAELVQAHAISWEVVRETGQRSFPLQDHPLARERYRNLLLHTNATAAVVDTLPPDGLRAALQWTVCHRLLSSPSDTATVEKIVVLPSFEEPIVTVVVHGASDVRIASRCVTRLLLAYTEVNFEIIVVEEQAGNFASDIEQISGIRVVRGEPGSDLSALLNKAVRTARGSFIAFVHAEIEPFARWLDELYLAFALFDNVAIAGPKIVSSTGRLHTLGGILSSSGKLHETKVGTNAAHPKNSYARQVDVVSLKALMIPRDCFLSSGGFDREITRNWISADLSLAVTSRGEKAISVPTSVVCLHEQPGLVGSDWLIRADQSIDFAFQRKWLDRYNAYGTKGQPSLRDLDLRVRRRVLFADLHVPRADIDGGSYAAIQEIRLLQALGFKVTFLSIGLAHLGMYTEALQRTGVEAVYAPFAATVEETIAERAGEFDLIYIMRYNVAKVILPALRKHNPQGKVVVNVADLHFLRELRAAIAANSPEGMRRSKLTRNSELEVLRQVDLALTYSDVEQGIILSHTLESGKVAKAPWVVQPQEVVTPHERRRNIAFVGSFGHFPNGEAVTFFVNEVMPLLVEKLPDLNFLIYGSQMTPAVRALATPNVRVIGHVDDLATVYNGVAAVVAPLRSGAGIKAKVLGAMASGVPTVLSPIAAEGIGARRGVDYLGATTPKEWVQAIQTLVADPETWQRVSASALDLVQENYSFERGREMMRSALEMVDIFTPNEPKALWCRMHLPPLM